MCATMKNVSKLNAALLISTTATLSACSSDNEQDTPITPENNIPVIQTFTADSLQVFNGQTITLSATASDADGDALTFSYAPSESFECEEGLTQASVTVSDGNGGSVSDTLDITCNLNTDEISAIITADSRATLGGIALSGQTPVATLDNGDNQRLAVFNQDTPFNIEAFNQNPDAADENAANVAYKLSLYTATADLETELAQLTINGAPLEIIKDGIVQDITCVDNANGLACDITGEGFEIGSKVDSLSCSINNASLEIPFTSKQETVSTFSFSSNEQIRANFNNGETVLDACVATLGERDNPLDGTVRIMISAAQGPTVDATKTATFIDEAGSVPEYAFTSANVVEEEGITYALVKTLDGVSTDDTFNTQTAVIGSEEICYSVRAEDVNENVTNEDLGCFSVREVALTATGGDFDGRVEEVTEGEDTPVTLAAPTFSVETLDATNLNVVLSATVDGSSSDIITIDDNDVVIDASGLSAGDYNITALGTAGCNIEGCNDVFAKSVSSDAVTLRVTERANTAPTIDEVNDFDGSESQYNTAYNSVTIELTTPTCTDVDGDTLSVNVYQNDVFIENVQPSDTVTFSYPEISDGVDTIAAKCFDGDLESSEATKTLRISFSF